MGWTTMQNRYKTIEEFVKEQILQEKDIEFAIRGNFVYLATISNHGYTYASIVKIEKRKGEISYKEMNEFEHPYGAYSCPKHILDKLTPLEEIAKEKVVSPEYIAFAKKWRELNLDKKTFSNGLIVKVHTPIKFQNGDTYKYFAKLDIGKQWITGLKVVREHELKPGIDSVFCPKDLKESFVKVKEGNKIKYLVKGKRVNLRFNKDEYQVIGNWFQQQQMTVA